MSSIFIDFHIKMTSSSITLFSTANYKYIACTVNFLSPQLMKSSFILIEIFNSSTYLDGSGSDVTIVRKTSSKGRAIVECILGLSLCEFELLLEGLDLLPILKNFLFFFGEVRSLRDYYSNKIYEDHVIDKSIFSRKISTYP